MATTLEHGGKTIDNPPDADLDRALEGPRDDDWFLSLYRGEDGDCMEAMIDAGDLWVEVTEGDRFVQARSQLDPAIVRSMLVSWRDGTDHWRDLALWKEPPPAKKDTLKGPAGLILGLVLLLVAVGLVGFITGNGGWIAIAFALAFPGIIAVAAAVKIGEAKRAATWTKASGRVTRSELATETRYDKQVQVPRIEYEYKVGFHTLVGKRVNFAELIAGAQAKEALARYPVGTSVPVYYDPADPSKAVIERELPAFINAIWGVVAFLTAAILFAAWWFLVR
jgi:hypothetical protein